MKTDRAGHSVRLHFRKYGDPASPKLVILHGLFGSGANWRSVAKQLSTSHEVFCPDLRNHGRSAWRDDMEYPLMAGDVARFIADQQLRETALLGHSMGGKTAMTLAREPSINLAKLIIVDIAPVPYAHAGHLQLLDAMGAIDLETATGREQIDAALSSGVPDPATRQFLLQNLIRQQNRYHWRINLEAIRRNMEALAGYDAGDESGGAGSVVDAPSAVDSPSVVNALFIAGANSDYIRPASHTEIHRRFPNARIETIENAGHWLHAERPARLVALCRAFLGG